MIFGKDRRTTMEMSQQKPPDTSVVQITPNELVKLIRKLRWIGMEGQAERLLRELARRHPTAAYSILATPGETD